MRRGHFETFHQSGKLSKNASALLGHITIESIDTVVVSMDGIVGFPKMMTINHINKVVGVEDKFSGEEPCCLESVIKAKLSAAAHQV